ncbi:MAG: glycosyltransferase [Desulfovibrio sp.]|jgi:glycosyltransferase involved in cell wall biosynthesis|nr:glycosyltransferase [Desulfovibrio sp.]
MFIITWILRVVGMVLPKADGTCSSTTDPVWVVGYFSQATGLGEGARLYYREVKESGRKVFAIDISKSSGKAAVDEMFQGLLFTPRNCPAQNEAGTIVFHVNPPHIMAALWRCRELVRNKRRVAYWAWELEEIPPFWVPCLSHFDAIECPSVFTADAIRRKTRKPISVHPPRILERTPSQRNFAEDGKMRVLSIFDLASNISRKNPIAAIKAFQSAFGNSEKVELILKTNLSAHCLKEFNIIQESIGRSGNIQIMARQLTREELEGLYCRSDVYISLHCSEGYGLTIREAMEFGLEVVATGWSGNMDFMQGPKCHAVPYSFVQVYDAKLNVFSHMKKQQWAKADVAQAAEILRSIADFRKWSY